ncbi:ADP-ribose pyrophosphatase YjhB (NUDIX family) [Rhizobium leguminosarum]|nr:ADP-ribose pyrophosphatase YjhB (NUDIX family) [Rhizobium leguminosarum]
MAEIPIRSFGVSVILLRNSDTETDVLMLRRNHTLVGEWCQIAGGIEDGEKAWETALREVKECCRQCKLQITWTSSSKTDGRMFRCQTHTL